MAAARQQEVGDVGARDQQHQRHGAQQDQHRRLRQAADHLGHRLHDDAPLLLEVGILRVQLLLDALEIRVGARDGGRGREPAEDAAPVPRARGAVAARRQHHRHEERVVLHHPRAPGQHADHGARDLVEHHSAPDDAGVGAEAGAPEVFRDHHDVGVAAGTVLVRQESAAQQRRDAQHLQELVTHLHAVQALGHVAAKVVADRHRDRQCVKCLLVLAPVEERAAGHAVGAAVGTHLGDQHHAVRLGVGQRAQEHRVEHAVDGGVGADAERERQDGDDGEAGTAGQQAKTDPGVLPQLRGEVADATTTFHRVPQLRQRVGARIDFAEFLQRLRAGVRRRHALARELVGAHVEVKRELVADVGGGSRRACGRV